MTMRDEAARLASEHESLSDLLEAARRSARLHALRAHSLRLQADESAAQLQRVRTSSSWRLTRPLRGALMLLRSALRYAGRKRSRGRREGPVSISDPVSDRLSGRPGPPDVDPNYLVPLSRTARETVAPRVLIIAELSIPHCAKYRVWQKREHLLRLGVAATVVDWRQTRLCLSALQVHAKVIFYRVPAAPEVLRMLREAARLQVETMWEVDDLIIDASLYVENRNLSKLDESLRREVLSGVAGYRAALIACDEAVASTRCLAEVMRAATSKPVSVVENALDQETITTASALRTARARRLDKGTEPGRPVLIAYGSGTKTHDVDFLELASALAEVMRERSHVRLRVMGELTLPPEIERFGDRVERLPATGFGEYLRLLAEADVTVAPLEKTVFNDAKSNIKFLEAAVLGMPCVCSPRESFRQIVRDGDNGLLADTTDEWRQALLRLVDDPATRRRLGEAACVDALERYAPEAVAARQVAPLVRGLDRRRGGRLRVLVVNVYFSPQSFGGATIVAEELSRRMAARHDTEVVVFTTHRLPGHPANGLVRYEWGDVSVIAARQPSPGDRILEFDNPLMADAFREVLAAADPDVVSFHCVQHIGASCGDLCRELGIPYVVTLHDAWWLCQRQFMVTGEGRYCHQRTIDLATCERCIPEAEHLRTRFDALQSTLAGAAMLVAPSEFHRDLHVANGHAPERVVVNRNGVFAPGSPRPPRAPGPLRFGFVGGNEEVKGIGLIRAAFAQLRSSDHKLVLVDNTLKLGFSAWKDEAWTRAPRIEIVPAYERDEMDAFFASIDVLLFPSQWKESFGLTVREALMRDVWVVVTDAGGAVEDVVDGVNGTVLPMDGDPRRMRDAVAALIADPGRLKAYSNPHKDRLAGFDGQVAQLRELLADAAGRRSGEKGRAA